MRLIRKHCGIDFRGETRGARIMELVSAGSYTYPRLGRRAGKGRAITLMNTSNSILPEAPQETRMEEIQARLRKLERRDWWLWAIAIVVMLLLTAAVVSL